MPKQTFFNLSEEKRQTIEQAALDEFSEYGFDASNMNRIVEQGKFAKGSFYQYFEDKKDLYFHLVDTIFKKKMHYLTPFLKNYKECSFSQNIEALLYLGLEFSADDPKLQRLGEDFATKRQAFANEFFEKYKPEATNIYTAVLTNAQCSGELHEDINIHYSSFFISSLINQTTILLMSRTEDTEKIVRELLSFLSRAILK